MGGEEVKSEGGEGVKGEGGGGSPMSMTLMLTK